jgi:hypothetical protein
MIALAGKNGANISANETRRVNKMGIPIRIWSALGQEDTFLGFIQHSFYTSQDTWRNYFVCSLRSRGNLKCVHFYDNQFEGRDPIKKRDTDVHEDCTLEVSQEFKDLCQLFRENQIT